MSDSTDLPPVPFSRPCIGREEEEAVIAVMRSGWLTTGAVAAKFEEEFARAVGAKHALALNSATAGLHLALEALGADRAASFSPRRTRSPPPRRSFATWERILFSSTSRKRASTSTRRSWRRCWSARSVPAAVSRRSFPCTLPGVPATWRRSATSPCVTAFPSWRTRRTRSPCGTGINGSARWGDAGVFDHQPRQSPREKGEWW